MSAAELPAVVPLAELGRMVDIRPQRLLRYLKSRGCEVIRLTEKGRGVLVPLASFRQAFPDLWESYLLKMSIRANRS